MASPFDEYDFVENPLEDFFCPVTFKLLLDAHQTLCCEGNHLSLEAVERLQHEGNRCPLCRKTLETVPDNFWRRKVRELKVRCRNNRFGCPWVGEIGCLSSHLKENSLSGNCQYVEVVCPNSCGGCFQRRHLAAHWWNDCSKRPFLCNYCEYEATYEEITNEHLPVCEKYPLHCPNKCGESAIERQHLQRHLDETCSLQVIECECGEPILRQEHAVHKWNSCPQRPFTCQHCTYHATYEEITQNHWPGCEKYPLQCPNQCGESSIERQHLQRHLDETCPLQVIECEFSYAGCGAKLQRALMQAHMDDSVKTHLSMVSKFQKREKEEHQQQVDALLARVIRAVEREEQHYQQNQALLAQITSGHVTLNLASPVTVPRSLSASLFSFGRGSSKTLSGKHVMHSVFPVQATMTDFAQHLRNKDLWYSPPFYSHIGGHKICWTVAANGLGSGEGTHVSVLVCMMRGEYDEYLHWPFRGDITVQLLNQRRDQQHVELVICIDGQTSDNVAGRVVGREISNFGKGYHMFIAHAALGYNVETNTEYLKNDCLVFQVTNIVFEDC